MKRIVLVALFSTLTVAAYAQAPAPGSATPAATPPGDTTTDSPTCTQKSTTQNLHGAAEKSFLTKCRKDAQAGCDKQAADKKLYGAAKTSFTKKCVNDAVGT